MSYTVQRLDTDAIIIKMKFCMSLIDELAKVLEIDEPQGEIMIIASMLSGIYSLKRISDSKDQLGEFRKIVGENRVNFSNILRIMLEAIDIDTSSVKPEIDSNYFLKNQKMCTDTLNILQSLAESIQQVAKNNQSTFKEVSEFLAAQLLCGVYCGKPGKPTVENLTTALGNAEYFQDFLQTNLKHGVQVMDTIGSFTAKDIQEILSKNIRH